MRRALLAILCSFLLAHPGNAVADAASDQEMANRYLRAAQSGDDEAQFYLGALYSAGVGVPRSDQEAFRWISRAANQGHSHAMLILAGLYAIGRGVEKNSVEAYKWAYIVNGASKIEEFRNGSRQLIGVLEGRMSSREINQAKSSATQWRSTPGAGAAPAVAPNDFPRAPQPPAPPAGTPAATETPTITLQPPPKTSDSSSSVDTLVKKGDIDNFFKEVPSLRKKFGF